jgi:hypothetical protein
VQPDTLTAPRKSRAMLRETVSHHRSAVMAQALLLDSALIVM